MTNIYELRAYPRIHVSLIDTGRSSLYSPGGIGFAVSARPLVLFVGPSRTIDLVGFDLLDQPARFQCAHLVEKLALHLGITGVRVELVGAPPQHQGYGSKSLILSGLVNALCNMSRAAIPVAERQRLTGRGGTSGIGIHTFFEGGLVLDAGRRTGSDTETLPSSAGAPEELPIKIGRWPLERLTVALIDVPGALHSGPREAEIFRLGAKLAADELSQVMRAIYHGLVPAMLSAQLDLIAASLCSIHDVGFKAAELRAQTIEVQTSYRSMRELGIACGMSSMGPLLYALLPEGQAADGAVDLIRTLPNVRGVEICRPRNSGYEWRSIDG